MAFASRLLVGAVGLALVATGCGSTSTAPEAEGSTPADCAAFSAYGKHDGKKVSVYSPSVTPRPTSSSRTGSRSRSAPA
ncbi:hypothetical protein [Nonomuraea recticatena]|uniref:hypothetical protein n=1 Tax=Nonomuraea recticatena TaxID=46178 RepID=UPI00361D4E3A